MQGTLAIVTAIVFVLVANTKIIARPNHFEIGLRLGERFRFTYWRKEEAVHRVQDEA